MELLISGEVDKGTTQISQLADLAPHRSRTSQITHIADLAPRISHTLWLMHLADLATRRSCTLQISHLADLVTCRSHISQILHLANLIGRRSRISQISRIADIAPCWLLKLYLYCYYCSELQSVLDNRIESWVLEFRFIWDRPSDWKSLEHLGSHFTRTAKVNH